MYLKGSKWSMSRRTRRSNPWRVILLFILVGGAIYFNQVIVPDIPPPGIPTPTPTRPPESFVSEAENLASSGKMSLALTPYAEAIQTDPKNLSNYLAAARLQMAIGDYQGALTSSENALLLNQNNSMANALRGMAKGYLKDYLVGEAAINHAIELDQNNASAYAYLAEVIALEVQDGQGDLGSLDKAVEASRTAMNLGPNLLETHRARGIVLELTANYAEAVSEFQAAIAINSNIADLHLALGRNYRFLQQYDKAIEEFNRANALNATDPMANVNISRTYATVGEYAKAIQFAQAAVDISPEDPFLYGNLGTMQYSNRQYQDAIQSLRLAVRGGTAESGHEIKGLALDYGRIAEYYYRYGLALAHQGQCGEALQISQLLQQGVPNDDISVYNAQEMVNICKQLSEDNGTTEATESSGNDTTPTPKTNQKNAEASATPEP
jgi:tetratricopeptide (TPR) repeat protein